MRERIKKTIWKMLLNVTISPKQSERTFEPFPTYNKSAADNFEKERRQKYGNSLKGRVELLKMVENIVAKGKIAHWSNSSIFSKIV